MLKYTIRRLLQSLITLFIVVSVVFLLMRLLPVEGYFGDGYDKLSDSQREAVLQKMGLLDPWYMQMGKFYNGLLHGDMGVSTIYRKDVPVLEVIAPRVPYSMKFGLVATGLALVAGLAMGVSMAKRKGKTLDKIWTGYVVFVNAVPLAVYLLFIQLYGTSLLNFPLLFDKFRPSSWILPALSMSLGGIAGYAMWMRRYMVDELNKDYIKLAKAKGLSQSTIMVKHVMRNAYVPMAQYLPASILMTISGSIYIESLYSIPGMGGLLVDVIQRQDNQMVQALVLIFSSIGIIGLFLGDLLMALFDPRIKLSKSGASR
ncbi:MAG: ABC transporter permease [Spirochaetia bacterium]|jgi:oligopeptide transport system permease protein|nr:ABC transporter permease [Spirochaetia bacterium]